MRRLGFEFAMRSGNPDVDGILASVTPAQLNEWRIWSRIEPWGEYFDDERHGDLCSTIFLAGLKKVADSRQFMASGRRRKREALRPDQNMAIFASVFGAPPDGIGKPKDDNNEGGSRRE